MNTSPNKGYMPYLRIDRVVTAHSRSVMANYDERSY